MLHIKAASGMSVISVDGNIAELMLFFCFWQCHLWPGWMTSETFGDSDNLASNQHRNVIKTIKSGDPVLFSINGKPHSEAFDFAIDRCKLLGIKVSQVSESLSHG